MRPAYQRETEICRAITDAGKLEVVTLPHPQDPPIQLSASDALGVGPLGGIRFRDFGASNTESRS